MKIHWDRALRPIGAFMIVAFSIVMLSFSFYMRERPAPGATLSKFLHSAATLETWFYDLRTSRFYNHEKISPNLVILELDNESLQKVGRFPWPRSHYATLLDNLRSYGATTVMFDVAFPEPESTGADSAFAGAIERFAAVKNHSAILGYGLTANLDLALSPLPEAFQMGSSLSGTVGKEPMPSPQYVDSQNFVAPLLLSWETKFGSISAESDADGIFRHASVFSKIGDALFPSLGAAGYIDFLKALGGDASASALPGGQGFSLLLKKPSGDLPILVSPRGEIKVRYFGGEQNFLRVPAWRVFQDKHAEKNGELKKVFGGKAVLFGSSAMGAHDLRHTPVDSEMPGMYMHANLFHALDQDFFFQNEDSSFLFSVLLLVAGMACMLLLARREDPLTETLGVAAVAGGLWCSDYFFFAPHGYFIRLFFCLFAVVSLNAFFTILNLFQEAQEKKRIRETFTRYVAPSIVKEMLANPEELRVGGEKKVITMLFSDVRDFTSISERLSPADLSALLNVYMGQMTDILFDSEGTLDKYIGDALVGFWGAPLDISDHAYKAVRAAKLMADALPTINEGFKARKYPTIDIGIGLNTGEVVVGNMGSDRIFQYTALGDAMNLASRLESLTKQYGVNLIISEYTLDHLGTKCSEFKIRSLDCVQVKGKTKAVKIFEIIPNASVWNQNPALLERFETAYGLYLKAEFSRAETEFSAVLREIPDDTATKKLLAATQAFIKIPPAAGWDGVTVFSTK